jgi:endogenous inhibitor of DNA gyrase (YacG/DUF329 family)
VKSRLVNCPVCGKPAPFDASNPYRPFCTKRCKLIDLGQWANESYRVPVNTEESQPPEGDQEQP